MRTSNVAIIVGTRKTGKTTFKKNLVAVSQATKKLIVDTFDSKDWRDLGTFQHPENASMRPKTISIDMLPFWKSGLYRIFSSDTSSIMEAIDLYCLNTLIVFEDAGKYFDSNISREQKRILKDTKQKSCDVILSFHSLAEVPPGVLRIADTLTLLKTSDKEVPAKFDFRPEVATIFEKVRKSKDKHEMFTIQLI